MVGEHLGTSQFVFKEAPGDVNLKDPLWKMPEMGIFTSFLRKYLISREVDLVVHSWKDLPTETDGLTEIVGTMDRADPRDLLIVSKEALKKVAGKTFVVLSSSPRRQFNLPEFLKKSIPGIQKIEFKDVRGNIQTRLSKIGSEGDALIVAKAAIDRFLLAKDDPEFAETAALVRSKLDECRWQILPLSVNPTAAAQGALAVEMSSHPDLAHLREAVAAALPGEVSAVNTERAILQQLGGGCHQRIGCTILDRPYGRVTFLRGQTDGMDAETFVRKVDQPGERPIVTNACQIGGKGGIQFFTRQDLCVGRKILQSLEPRSSGLFVAKADALPTGDIPDRPVWTSGVETWFALAKRGIWVNGTSDSLGEEEPMAIHPLVPEPVEWIKVSHTATQDPNTANQHYTIPTYKLIPHPEMTRELLMSKTSGKESFFFSSGSSFDAFCEFLPEMLQLFKTGEVPIGCGPGNSFKHIRRSVPNVIVAYDFADFTNNSRQ